MATQEIEFGTIGKADENPFKRVGNPVAEDHPLLIAFRESFDSGEILEVQTTTPEGVEKLLRKIARQEGLGVRLSRTASGVAFLARNKRAHVRKPKVEEGDADE